MEDFIDGPKQDIVDPITGKLIARKAVKRKAPNRTYLALSDLRSRDGLKVVRYQPTTVVQPSTTQMPQNGLMRGRVSYSPLPSGGGASDIPTNL